MEQPLSRRHSQQRAHLAASAGLPEDGDVARIAAERGDIVAHPFKGGDQIQQADVAGLRVFFATQFGQVQVAEHIEAMIDGDNDHVLFGRQVPAVVHLPVGGAGGVSAAVIPHHNRALTAQAGRPNIQVQAVFAAMGVTGGLLRHRLRDEL